MRIVWTSEVRQVQAGEMRVAWAVVTSAAAAAAAAAVPKWEP